MFKIINYSLFNKRKKRARSTENYVTYYVRNDEHNIQLQ